MSYRDDEAARSLRANVLIDEIAELERQKLAQATVDQRIETARRELATLQASSAAVVEQPPGLLTHVLVFGAAAAVTFAGYSLLF